MSLERWQILKCRFTYNFHTRAPAIHLIFHFSSVIPWRMYWLDIFPLRRQIKGRFGTKQDSCATWQMNFLCWILWVKALKLTHSLCLFLRRRVIIWTKGGGEVVLAVESYFPKRILDLQRAIWDTRRSLSFSKQSYLYRIWLWKYCKVQKSLEQ